MARSSSVDCNGRTQETMTEFPYPEVVPLPHFEYDGKPHRAYVPVQLATELRRWLPAHSPSCTSTWTPSMRPSSSATTPSCAASRSSSAAWVDAVSSAPPPMKHAPLVSIAPCPCPRHNASVRRASFCPCA